MRSYVFVAALAAALAAPSLAFAQAAANTSQGHIVVRTESAFGGFFSNAAIGGVGTNPNVGIGVGSPLNGQGTAFSAAFSFAPSADYFLTDHITVGAAVDISVFQINAGGLGTVTAFSMGLMPRVGWSQVLLERVSVWPTVGIGVGFATASGRTTGLVPIDVFVPLYYHPKENFFVGIGPGLLVQPVTPVGFITVDPLRFTLGGDLI
jgi:hypothetical protein